MTVLNAANQQFGRIEPYLSLTEFLSSPNASMLDFSTFVEGGDQADQEAALEQLIIRASAKVDNYCMGKLGTLNAMANTEPAIITPDRFGTFIVHPEFNPILAVTAFQWGSTPGAGNVVTLSSDNCFVDNDHFRVTQTGAGSSIAYSGIGALSAVLNGRQGSLRGPYYCVYTYVNGFPNTFTTAEILAGVSSVPLVSAEGIFPGMQLVFWDGSNDETVTVASTYVAGSLNVTLASPTVNAHVAGTNFSSPQLTSVKQAVIHMVIGMVHERGQTGFTIEASGEMTPAEMRGSSHEMDEIRAYDLLDVFVRSWGKQSL